MPTDAGETRGTKRRPFTVFLVIDDQTPRTALADALRSHKLEVRDYMTVREFLFDFRKPSVGILLAEIRARGMTWKEVLSQARRQKPGLPIAFIAGHRDAPAAVQAVREGAFDFVNRPGTEEEILPVLMRAYGTHYDTDHDAGTEDVATAIPGFDRLSPRELEVLHLICAGRSSREIAADLGIGSKTVEAHRARINTRLRKRHVSQVLRVYRAILHPDD